MNENVLIAAVIISSIVSVALLIVAAISLVIQQQYRRRYKISALNTKDSASYYIDSLTRILMVRTGISAYIVDLIQNGIEYEYVSLVDRLESFISVCVDETKFVFTGMTRERCAVAIKIVKDEKEVYTLARDRHSISIRGEETPQISYHLIDGNTDFSSIYYLGDKFFFCNDLRALEKKGRYSNTNRNWKEHYNATCVVPIKHVSPDADSGKIIGFLCIDTLRGRLEEALTVSYLTAVAAVLSYAIGVMQDLDKSAMASALAQDDNGREPMADQ